MKRHESHSDLIFLTVSDFLKSMQKNIYEGTHSLSYIFQVCNITKSSLLLKCLSRILPTKISNSVSLHFFSISRLAQIFFTMPTILVGRNKSYLSNQHSCLPKINTQFIVLNYSMARSINPTPNLFAWLRKVTLFEGRRRTTTWPLFTTVYLLKNAFRTQHNGSYGKVKVKVLIIS